MLKAKTLVLGAMAAQLSLFAWEDHPDKDSFSLDKTIETSGNPNDHYQKDDQGRNDNSRSSPSEERGCIGPPDRDK